MSRFFRPRTWTFTNRFYDTDALIADDIQHGIADGTSFGSGCLITSSSGHSDVWMADCAWLVLGGGGMTNSTTVVCYSNQRRGLMTEKGSG